MKSLLLRRPGKRVLAIAAGVPRVASTLAVHLHLHHVLPPLRSEARRGNSALPLTVTLILTLSLILILILTWLAPIPTAATMLMKPNQLVAANASALPVVVLCSPPAR